jgi:hypothetical protein
MNDMEALVIAGFAKMRDEVTKYLEETGRMPHMMWAFTTDPLVTEDTPFRYSMAEIPEMPLDTDLQKHIIDQASEEMAMSSWRFIRPELQIAMFVGPFWPNQMPGLKHQTEYPTVIVQTWINGHGVSSLLYHTHWKNGALDHVGTPEPVEYIGETYAERFAERYQGLASARLN